MDNILFNNSLPEKLSNSEQRRLFEEYKNGSKEAKEKIMLHNMRLVVHFANKFANTSDVKREDLVSIGSIGLGRAVDTFDLSKNIHFSTYASRCIKNEILKYFRKKRKEKNVDSLDRIIIEGVGGRGEISLKDIISDNVDIAEDFEKKETYQKVHEIVDSLPEREKKIIRMAFGFDGRVYTQQEIARILNRSQSNISRIISNNLIIIKQQLLGEESNESIEVIKSNEKSKKERKPRKNKTIYELLSNYPKEQIDALLNNLTSSEQELIALRYGNDLNNPINAKLNKKQSTYFYSIIKKLRNKLNKQKESQIDKKDADKEQCITKDEYKKILESLKTQTFVEMMNTLSVKKAIILSLKLGYIDGKCFSTDAIAHFLDITPLEVRKIVKESLMIYRDKIVGNIDCAINVVTDERVLRK